MADTAHDGFTPDDGFVADGFVADAPPRHYTPQEVKARFANYAPAQGNTDPSNFGIAKEALKGAGKFLADPMGISHGTGLQQTGVDEKGEPMYGIGGPSTGPLAPSGEGQEFGATMASAPMVASGALGAGKAVAGSAPKVATIARRLVSPEGKAAAVEALPKGKEIAKWKDIVFPPEPKPAPVGSVLERVNRPAFVGPRSGGARSPEIGNATDIPANVANPPYIPPERSLAPSAPKPRSAAAVRGEANAQRIIRNQQPGPPGMLEPIRADPGPPPGPPQAQAPPPMQGPPMPPVIAKSVVEPPAGVGTRVPPTVEQRLARANTPAPNPVAEAEAEAADVGNTPPNPAQALADEMKRSGTAPTEQPRSGISREAYEAHNRNLKLNVVEEQLRKQGIASHEDLSKIPDAQLDSMFRAAEQHRAGFYSQNPAMTRGQLALRFGAPINLRNPNIPAQAQGGVAIPTQPDANSHLPDSAHDGPPLPKLTHMAHGGVVVPHDGPPTTLGHQLKGLTHLRTSNLPEAMQTAQAISKATGTPISSKSKDLHGWKLGGADAGRYIRKPNATPAKGESLNSFKRRALSAVKRSLADSKADPSAKIGLVTHPRVLQLAEAWVKSGARPDLEIDRQHMASHGEAGPVLRLHHKPDGVIGMQKMTKGKLQGGVHLIAHGATT